MTEQGGFRLSPVIEAYRSWKRRVCGWLGRWFTIFWLKVAMSLVYVLLIVVVWVFIRHRVHPTNWQAEVPLVAALVAKVRSPKKFEYVAATNLEPNHQLRQADLAFPKPTDLDEALRGFLPDIKWLVKQYIRHEIRAGSPIFQKDLSQKPIVEPEPGSYLAEVQLPVSGRLKSLEPKTKIYITLDGSSEKLEGVVLFTSSSPEVGPSPAGGGAENQAPEQAKNKSK